MQRLLGTGPLDVLLETIEKHVDQSLRRTCWSVPQSELGLMVGDRNVAAKRFVRIGKDREPNGRFVARHVPIPGDDVRFQNGEHWQAVLWLGTGQ
jgi:hypothetical protein